jgi:hypothetical protein
VAPLPLPRKPAVPQANTPGANMPEAKMPEAKTENEPVID